MVDGGTLATVCAVGAAAGGATGFVVAGPFNFVGACVAICGVAAAIETAGFEGGGATTRATGFAVVGVGVGVTDSGAAFAADRKSGGVTACAVACGAVAVLVGVGGCGAVSVSLVSSAGAGC
jgi:hypothetical protein